MAGTINIYDRNGYLDWNKIDKLTKGCSLVSVVGGRGIGKTYGLSRLLLKKAKNHPFLYLRTTQKQADIVSKPETHPFKALEADGEVPMLTTKPVAKDLAGVYEAEIEDETDKILAIGNPLCYIAALSTFSNLRGLSFEEIEYVLYDEFIEETTSRKTIKNAGMSLLQLYETINRNREIKKPPRPPLKMYLLANANDIANDIFIELGLVKKAEEMMRERQTISIDEKRGIAMIYIDHSPISERKKHTALYRMTASPDSQFNKMALESRYYTDESALIRPYKLPGEWVPVCSINGITIYSHKSSRKYYVSTYHVGTCKSYGTSYAEKKRFLNNHLGLWMSYLNNRVIFEEYLCLVLFEQAFDAK